MVKFGIHIRRQREALRESDSRYSVRQVAARIGVEPSYLSKIERDLEPPPSEAKIRALAKELGEDPDSLLALAGKVALDLQATIRRRPLLFPKLIRELKSLPDAAVLRMVRSAQSRRVKRRKDH
jgi:transcriptional regulator with XRE-family HTH domain